MACGEVIVCARPFGYRLLPFYRPVPGGIEVLRILHGARDIQSILAEEFGGEDADDDDELET